MMVAAATGAIPGSKLSGKAERLARINRLSRIMDSAFAIPGTRIRLGADTLIGLAPGVGDLVTQAVSAYIIYEAHRLGIPKHKLLRMGGNLLVDTVIGAVPLLGDIGDMFFRANNRNMRIIREHLETLPD
ncbi:DUF4112 domain-containing protein [Terrihabitans rhizophilus]|jgi:hypothetical protein|uniref:DUF4112 domain-containing protein n=1 Tax=Terrihabitans rhizophilus TaxID=3092662 RepID=A0ABU4RR24_9HYPH|nr:DUF4112 domain-containing protein [Terrihabitans sp. PJ23]MDX6807291.1 DUF4112 domain-containing protein [Terrihabitans sp. PJ23]